MKKQLIVALACLSFLASCRDQTAWIRKMGFVPLNPPSQLLSPGAVIMRRNQFSRIQLLCSAEESFGQDFQPSKSRTVGGRYRRGKKIGWRIKGDALKQIQVAANSQDIQEVFVQVENARISALTDVDVLLAATKRSAACQAAIKRRVAEGYDISIISQSLTADVSYSVQFSSEADAHVKARLAQLQAVSVTLGGSFKATSNQSASAKNLVYGLKDDPFLADILPNDADVQALRGQQPVQSKRQSLFFPDEMLTSDGASNADGSETSWSVASDADGAELSPATEKGYGAFDGATAEDERTGEEIDEDDYQDMLDKNNHRGRWAPQGEPEIQDDAGFVPSEGGAPAEEEQPSAPVSPRSPRAK